MSMNACSAQGFIAKTFTRDIRTFVKTNAYIFTAIILYMSIRQKCNNCILIIYIYNTFTTIHASRKIYCILHLTQISVSQNCCACRLVWHTLTSCGYHVCKHASELHPGMGNMGYMHVWPKRLWLQDIKRRNVYVTSMNFLRKQPLIFNTK